MISPYRTQAPDIDPDEISAWGRIIQEDLSALQLPEGWTLLGDGLMNLIRGSKDWKARAVCLWAQCSSCAEVWLAVVGYFVVCERCKTKNEVLYEVINFVVPFKVMDARSCRYNELRDDFIARIKAHRPWDIRGYI